MHFGLKQLIIITCIALGGIIALQLFWLFKTYSEKKIQVLSTINSTMLETQIFTGVSPMLTNAVKVVAGNFIDSTGSINSTDSDIVSINEVYNLGDETDTGNGIKEKSVFDLLGLNRKGWNTYNLEKYKQQVSRALAYKGIHVSFELALFNAGGKIVACTTDSTAFMNTIEKSDKGFGPPVKLKEHLSGQLQMAIPRLAVYLLREMAVILIIALLLIIICCFSFYSMVKIFFKERKLADIRSDFMNNMTHELKTPISSASLALELMQDSSVTATEAEREEYIQLAQSELKRLSALVDKVLNMATFERTEVLISKRSFSADAWLEQVLDIIKPLTDRQQVSIHKTIDPPGITLWADPEYLTGLMQNLLENAIKYRDKIKPELIIDIIINQSETEYLIVIADNGIGIPEQYIDKIFEKFFRVPTGDRHDTKGYGLGLSYVQEIVRLHKGLINVRSEEKTGTRFEIKLPKKML